MSLQWVHLHICQFTIRHQFEPNLRILRVPIVDFKSRPKGVVEHE